MSRLHRLERRRFYGCGEEGNAELEDGLDTPVFSKALITSLEAQSSIRLSVSLRIQILKLKIEGADVGWNVDRVVL